MIHARQEDDYQAIAESTERTDIAPFIAFMLERILEACRAATPEVRPEATPEVDRLLDVLRGAMSRRELMRALGLKDVEHFRRHYLKPALESGWLEMTQPQSPRSPTQRYRLSPHARARIAQQEAGR